MTHKAQYSSGSDSAGSHEIFVWDVVARGQYLKTMENGKEPLVDLDVSIVSLRSHSLDFDTFFP